MALLVGCVVIACWCAVQGAVGTEPQVNTPPRMTLVSMTGSGAEVAVSEFSEMGTGLALLTVFDPDSCAQGRVYCHTSSQIVQLRAFDQHTYSVILSSLLDRELHSSYHETIVCSDDGDPPATSTTSFTLQVLDMNDNYPQFPRDVYYASVSEGTPLDRLVLTVQAVDPDNQENGQVSYSLSFPEDQVPRFRVVQETGEILTTGSLDRELMEQMEFTVLARDLGTPSLTGSATIRVEVSDINDNSPTFPSMDEVLHVPESTPEGTLLHVFQAVDADKGANGTVEFSMVTGADTIFSLSPHGQLTLTSTLDRNVSAMYALLIQAADRGMPPRVAYLRVTVLIE